MHCGWMELDNLIFSGNFSEGVCSFVGMKKQDMGEH